MPIDVCHLVPLCAFPQPPSTLGFVQAIPQEGKRLAISSVVLYVVTGRLCYARAQCLTGDPYYGPCPSRWLCCKVSVWGPDWVRYPRNSGDFPYPSPELATLYNWLRCPMSGVPSSSHRTSRTICDRAVWGMWGGCVWVVRLPESAGPLRHKLTVGRVPWGRLPKSHLPNSIGLARDERFFSCACHVVRVVCLSPSRVIFLRDRGQRHFPPARGQGYSRNRFNRFSLVTPSRHAEMACLIYPAQRRKAGLWGGRARGKHTTEKRDLFKPVPTSLGTLGHPVNIG